MATAPTAGLTVLLNLKVASVVEHTAVARTNDGGASGSKFVHFACAEAEVPGDPAGIVRARYAL
ncbi:hypothetical protein [Streptomyces sp. NPDC057686]|uniref:hypothetical protein n=1 Tax=Streptomyces sp. NPDC057686 TaxID=3346212 RepID=UPI0036742379